MKVITNGVTLPLRRAQELAEAGLNQVEISFDGLRPDTHDMSRGPGAFDMARRALANAQEARIVRTAVVWTIHSGNVSELDALPVFLEQANICECYISVFRKTGALGSGAPFNSLCPDDLNAVANRLSEWKEAFPHLTITLGRRCTCGRTSVVIGCDGTVRACPFLREGVGSVYLTPLLDLWRSIPAAGTGRALGYCASQVY